MSMSVDFVSFSLRTERQKRTSFVSLVQSLIKVLIQASLTKVVFQLKTNRIQSFPQGALSRFLSVPFLKTVTVMIEDCPIIQV